MEKISHSSRENQKQLHEQITKHLSSFNEQTFLDIVSELLIKARRPDIISRIIPVDKIRVAPLEPHKSASFSIAIGSETGTLHRIITVSDNTNKKIGRANVLWSLVHEQLHALTSEQNLQSHNGHYYTPGMSGVQKFEPHLTQEKPTLQYVNEPINEGVTEMITLRILRSYYARLGLPLSELDTVIDAKKKTPYPRYTDLVYQYRDRIAEAVGIDPSAVEQSIIYTYLHNGNISPSELVTELGVSPEKIKLIENVFDSQTSALKKDIPLLGETERAGADDLAALVARFSTK